MYRIAVFAKMLDFTVSQSASFTISAVPLSKVKPQIPPFAVVVRLILVDSGGYFWGLLSAYGSGVAITFVSNKKRPVNGG